MGFFSLMRCKYKACVYSNNYKQTHPHTFFQTVTMAHWTSMNLLPGDHPPRKFIKIFTYTHVYCGLHYLCIIYEQCRWFYLWFRQACSRPTWVQRFTEWQQADPNRHRVPAPEASVAPNGAIVLLIGIDLHSIFEDALTFVHDCISFTRALTFLVLLFIFNLYCIHIFVLFTTVFCWNKKKSNNFGWNILISINCCWFKFSIWFKYTSIIFPKIRFKLNIMLLEIASRISSSSLLNCKMRSKNRLPLVLSSLV